MNGNQDIFCRQEICYLISRCQKILIHCCQDDYIRDFSSLLPKGFDSLLPRDLSLTKIKDVTVISAQGQNRKYFVSFTPRII